MTDESSPSPRRLAFFGGTFDPPHLGHLIVARDVAEALDLEAVFFLPARIPPHKQDETLSPAETRLEMLKVAIQDDEVLGVSDLELQRDPPSYSVDTLRDVKERIPTAELYFIIGTDQLAVFDTWKEPEEVARLAHLVVITRGGEAGGAESVTCPVDVSYERVPVTRIELSSTRIRERVRAGLSVRYLVPEPVRRIIEREGLYK